MGLSCLSDLQTKVPLRALRSAYGHSLWTRLFKQPTMRIDPFVQQHLDCGMPFHYFCATAHFSSPLLICRQVFCCTSFLTLRPLITIVSTCLVFNYYCTYYNWCWMLTTVWIPNPSCSAYAVAFLGDCAPGGKLHRRRPFFLYNNLWVQHILVKIKMIINYLQKIKTKIS